MNLFEQVRQRRDQSRLTQLQRDKDACLTRFQQALGRSADRSSAGGAVAPDVSRDANLVLAHAADFDLPTVTGACRICPDGLAEHRNPIDASRLRGVLTRLDAENTADHLPVLNCLARLAQGTGSPLDFGDLCFLTHRLLGNAQVFAARQQFTVVLEAAQALQFPAWLQAAEAQLQQGNLNNAGWLYAQAVAQCQSLTAQEETLQTILSTLAAQDNFLLLAPTVLPFRAAGAAVQQAIRNSGEALSTLQQAVLLGYCFEAGQTLRPDEWSKVLRHQLESSNGQLNESLLRHYPLDRLADFGLIPITALSQLGRQVKMAGGGARASQQRLFEVLSLFILGLQQREQTQESVVFLEGFLQYLATGNEWDRLDQFMQVHGVGAAQYLAKALITHDKKDSLARIFPARTQAPLLLGIADELAGSANLVDQRAYFHILAECAKAGVLNETVHQQALLEHYCGNAQFDRLMDRPFEEKQTLAFYRERGLDAVPFLKFLTQRTLAGLPVSSLKPLMLQQRLVTEMAMPSRSADQLNTLAQCLARLAESPESLAPMLLSGYALWQPWQPLPSGLVFALRAAGAQGERVLQPQNLFRSIGQLGLEND